MKRSCGFILASVIAVTAFPADAAFEGANIAASACSMNEAFASKGETVGNLARFKGTNTGDLYMHCPVDPPNGNFVTGWYMQYSGDYDTTATNYAVKTELRTIATSSGTVTYRGINWSDQNLYENQFLSITNFQVVKDGTVFYIWVHLKRTGTLDNPTLYGIQLNVPTA